MTPKFRKLLPIEEDHNPSVLSFSHYSPTHSPSKNYQREDNPTTTSNYYNNLKLNPPFDSAMALTVLVLLTALFFMGFFSIYIRRFSDESSVDPTRRRRSSGTSQGDNSLPTTMSYLSRSRDSTRGVDAKVVNSLPVHAYFPGEAKQGMIDDVECAICLSEFEEKELMKEIPYCGHVFHVECIDTWLESHVTCPLCRTAKLLVEEEEEKIKIGVASAAVAVAVEVVEGGDGGGESGSSSGESEVRLVVEGGDTWNE
ncbi:RING-H2 finger protein ATL57-like [Chenopodium quinoa]|uniref:RING-H2 finger protein ATL57-like n=1 Tax=Chenopodium quinoa TaxID=63459 RepID=UPI000B777F72|nr:RING-H2 finger protein ATL57-like [Chenopodium quinoa]